MGKWLKFGVRIKKVVSVFEFGHFLKWALLARVPIFQNFTKSLCPKCLPVVINKLALSWDENFAFNARTSRSPTAILVSKLKKNNEKSANILNPTLANRESQHFVKVKQTCYCQYFEQVSTHAPN